MRHDDNSINGKEQDVAKMLAKELEVLENAVPVVTPDLAWFERQLAEGRRIQRRRLLRDLAVFWLVALCVLVLLASLLIEIPIAYVYLQVLVMIAAPLLLAPKLRKQGGS